MNCNSYLNSLKELNILALQSYENGDYLSAMYGFDKILELNPCDKDTLFNLAKVSFDAEKYEHCVQKLLELLDIGDTDDSTFILMGDAYVKLNKLSDALISYNRVSSKDLVEEKINKINETYKTEGDKLQKQYMDYPYPNTWANEGIPKEYCELIHLGPQQRRLGTYQIQYCDINFMLLKYLKEYKPLKKVRVLNAGCGTGEGLINSAFSYPEVEYVAIDISDNSIDIAKGHCEKLKIKNVKFYKKNIMELSPDDFGYFDIVISTGVLHHIPDPLTGFKNIRSILKEDGFLACMVYASLGRREVYDFRDIFVHMFSNVEQIKNKIDFAKGFLESTRDFQTINRIKTSKDINYGDQGIVDLLLNANETSYTTTELIELVKSADLSIDMYHNDYLNPIFTLYNIKNKDIIDRLRLLGEITKLRIAEFLNGSIFKHHFVAYRPSFEKKENLLFSDDWMESYPILWGGVFVKEDDKGYYIDLSFRKINNVSKVITTNEEMRLAIDEPQKDFFLQCFGKLTIKEIINKINGETNIPQLKKMLYELSKKDVIFFFDKPQLNYNG